MPISAKITISFLLLLHVMPDWVQRKVFHAQNGGAGANTFSLAQKSAIKTCSTATCSVTISISAGHLVVIPCVANVTSGSHCSGASGGGATWTAEATNGTGCAISSGAGATTSCVYTLATVSTLSSLTVNLDATGITTKFVVFDYTFSNPTCSKDTSGATTSNVSGGVFAGETLTLTGTNDVIVQWTQNPGQNVTAVSSPYGNFTNSGGIAFADNENTSSGTAPNWSAASGNNNPVAGIAFK